MLKGRYKGRVLFPGHCYYHTWYISRELRKLGWKADVLNWDANPANEMYYHGEDFKFTSGKAQFPKQLWFFIKSALNYDIFHFSNAHGMHFGYGTHQMFSRLMPEYEEVRWLRRLGKKIVYSNNGCQDGVSQTSFSQWKPFPICSICPWEDKPLMCSDKKNLTWGRVRNDLADYQCCLGGNRADYNDFPSVHETPEFFCLDSEIWNPDIEVPEKYKLHYPEGTVKIFHAVGNYDARTSSKKGNIKGTHIYLPIIERLKSEGHKIELMFFSRVPNKDLRFYQVQADIILENLYFGFFGATGREGMMLGRTVASSLRPEWLESMKSQIPDYVSELPIVNITPETAYDVVKNLVLDAERRREIGRRGREFALKWHSAKSGALRLDRIYSDLLGISPG
jgi:hypothetical protein